MGNVQDCLGNNEEDSAKKGPKYHCYRNLFMYSDRLQDRIEQQGKDMQDYLCELMNVYQSYHDLATQQYVLRGSKIKCRYGTKPALLDTISDHGVYMHGIPVMTCRDCRSWNIHNFGSCMCPESLYEDRLPMPVERDARGEVAQKAPYNKFPHICVPVIDVITGWQQEESSLKIDDGEEMGDALTDKAALVCRYGGFIQVVEIYEREGEKDKTELAEAAYQVLNQWLIGGDTAVSEEELIVAINDLALYGEINSIASLNKIDSPLTSMENRINESFKRNSKFDNIILAWTNYWNMTMEQEYGEAYSPVRPEVIKAMLVTETNLGKDNSTTDFDNNPERDIMQCLDPRNPLFWVVLGENSCTKLTIIKASEETANWTDRSGEKTITISHQIPGTGEKKFWGNGSWIAVHEIISDDMSKYYQEKVTPTLSIAVGTGYYCMRLNGSGMNGGTSLLRTEYEAVKLYNGGGDPDYCVKVNVVLENMGVDLLYENQ